MKIRHAITVGLSLVVLGAVAFVGRSRLPRMNTVAMALALFLTALPWTAAVADRAFASHPHPQSDAQHIVGLHYATSGHSFYDEDYCTESYTSTFTDSEIQIKVTSLIYAHGWDGTGDWKIDNYPTAYSCESY